MLGWLKPILIIKLAIAPTLNVVQAPYVATTPETRVRADVVVGAEIADIISIEGQIDTWMVALWEDGRAWFAPYQSDYYFRVYAEYEGFTIGYEHLCRHPVYTPGIYVTQWRGGHDEFWIEWRY